MKEYICEYCGNSVLKYESDAKKSNHIFCNHKCFGLWLSEKKLRESSGKDIPCDFCGKIVYKTGSQLERYKNQFCSTICKDDFIRKFSKKGKDSPIYTQVEVLCSNCNNALDVPNYIFKRNDKHFCDKACMVVYNKNNNVNTGSDNPNWKGGKINVKCEGCGIELKRKRSIVDKFNKFFCSAECRGKWISNNLKGKKHPTYSQVDYECDECGNVISFTKAYAKNGMKHYCSKECTNKAHSKIMTGENHPNWKGTTPFIKAVRLCKKYYEWRTKCFRRDNYSCQKCDNGSNKLVVHHIKHLIQIVNEYNITTMEEALNCKELWDINNGVTLCTDCHKIEHPLKKKEECYG